MSTFDRLKNLCDDQKLSIGDLEEKLGFGKNSLYGWKKKTPNGANLEKVADYFDVSIDYLLGRTDKKRYYELTEKDERSVQDEIQNILNNFSNSGFAAADGSTLEELDEDDKELLIAALEQSLRIAKRISKKKFTPKKYRD